MSISMLYYRQFRAVCSRPTCELLCKMYAVWQKDEKYTFGARYKYLFLLCAPLSPLSIQNGYVASSVLKLADL